MLQLTNGKIRVCCSFALSHEFFLSLLGFSCNLDWIEDKDSEARTFSMVSILPKWLGHSSSLRLGKSPIDKCKNNFNRKIHYNWGKNTIEKSYPFVISYCQQ